VRSAETGPEIAVRRQLWSEGLRYRVRPKLPGTPDLAFPRQRVAVFVDGCFWHGCPEHYRAPKKNADFWRAKIERNRARDLQVDADLLAMGWTVLHVWDHLVRIDLQAATSLVKRAVNREPSNE